MNNSTQPSIIGVIGVAGDFGAGKDTVGRFLIEDFGFTRRAFGDYLKREVQDAIKKLAAGELFLDDPYFVGMTEAGLDAMLACVATGQDPFIKPTSEDMRVLLQQWGTEFRRKQDPDYWVNALADDLPLPDHMVITDIRFQNEVDFVRAMGGVCWRVMRPDNRTYDYSRLSQHASERDIDLIDFDAYIENDSTLEVLRVVVRRALTGAPVEVSPGPQLAPGQSLEEFCDLYQKFA